MFLSLSINFSLLLFVLFRLLIEVFTVQLIAVLTSVSSVLLYSDVIFHFIHDRGKFSVIIYFMSSIILNFLLHVY